MNESVFFYYSLFYILCAVPFLLFHFAVFHQLNNEQQHFINVHEFSLQCTFGGDFEHIHNNTLAICLCDSSASHIVIVILPEWKFNIWVWLMYYYDRPVNPVSSVQCPIFMYVLTKRRKLINGTKESHKRATTTKIVTSTQNKQRTSHHIPFKCSFGVLLEKWNANNGICVAFVQFYLCLPEIMKVM